MLDTGDVIDILCPNTRDTSAITCHYMLAVTSPPPLKKLVPSVKYEKCPFAKHLGGLDHLTHSRTRRHLKQLLLPCLCFSVHLFVLILVLASL